MLLPNEFLKCRFNDPETDTQIKIEDEKRSLLSVVVESKEAKLFVIKQTHINLLPLETKVCL